MNKKGLYIRFFLLAAAVIIALIFFSGMVYYSSMENRHYDLTVTELTNGWKTDDGQEQSLSALPIRAVELTTDISSVNLKNMRFCTKSVDTAFELFADGKRIYSYYYEQPAISGISYGMNMHMIPVPEGTQELTLRVIPNFTDTAPRLIDTMIADPGLYMGDLFKNGIFNYSLCIVMLVIGMATLVIGVSGSMKAEFVSLGMFACLTALWSVNETMIPQVLTQKPELIRAMSYLSFAMIGYPPAAFIARITNFRRQWPLNVFAALSVGNLLLDMILNASGVMDFHYSAGFSRILIGLSMVFCGWLTVRALRQKKLDKRLLLNLAVSVIVAVTGAVIDLARFFFTESVLLGVGLFTRLGIFIFLLIFIRYIITAYSSARIEIEKAAVMRHLAYTDALTGLQNRLAFNEKELELKSHKNINCMIVQMDVNNLKVVNDVYGHPEGDRHICAAADIISKSLSPYGSCYRTGGDEFIAVLSPYRKEYDIEKVLEELSRLCEAYNESSQPPVKLHIACGYAVCDDASENLGDTEIVADQRMYEHKKKMKAAFPVT